MPKEFIITLSAPPLIKTSTSFIFFIPPPAEMGVLQLQVIFFNFSFKNKFLFIDPLISKTIISSAPQSFKKSINILGFPTGSIYKINTLNCYFIFN